MYDEFMKDYDMAVDEEDIVKMEEKKAIGLLEALNNLEKKCKMEKVPYNSEIKKIAISLLPEDYGTFETILNLIKKLQNENKELKADLYSANSIINEYIGTFKYFIPNQKVENKITELENANWYCESVKNQTIEALKELLEESEENNGE